MATPLNFLTGKVDNLNSLPIKQGQVIFAFNNDNTLCDIYYDISNTARLNITNKASYDSFGQDIVSTYLKELEIDNFAITPVFGDGEKGEESLVAFTGTRKEYELALSDGKIKDGMIIHITDDEDVATEPTVAVTKLPTANANHRGRILLLESNNSDKPYMCLKKSGIYAWYEIQTGTTGISGEGELPPATGATTAKLGAAVLGAMVLGQE